MLRQANKQNQDHGSENNPNAEVKSNTNKKAGNNEIKRILDLVGGLDAEIKVAAEKCWQILNIPNNSDKELTMKAYKKLSRSVHPDHNMEEIDAASKAFQFLSAAYAVTNAIQTKKNELRDAKISDAMDFYLMLRRLSPEQRIFAYESKKKDLPNLIKSIQDFNYIVEYLNDEQRLEMFETVKNLLSKMKFKKHDLCGIFRFIDIKKVQSSLPMLIDSTLDLEEVMDVAKPDEYMVILNAMKDKLPSLMTFGSYAYGYHTSVLKYLDGEQRAQAFEILKQRISEDVKSWWNLKDTCEYLKPNEISSILELVKDRLLQTSLSLDQYTTNIIGEVSEEYKILLLPILENLFEKYLIGDASINNIFSELANIRREVNDKDYERFFNLTLSKNAWFQVDKKTLEEEIFKYYIKEPTERISVLKSIQTSLSHVIPFNELDAFLTNHFSQETHIQEAREIYLLNFLEQIKTRLNHAEVKDCGLVKLSWCSLASLHKKLTDDQIQKDIIVKSDDSSFMPALFYFDHTENKFTRIYVQDGNKKIAKELTSEIHSEYKVANQNNLALIQKLIGPWDVSLEDKSILNELLCSITNAAQAFNRQERSLKNYKAFEKSCHNYLVSAKNKLDHSPSYKTFLYAIESMISKLGDLPYKLAGVIRAEHENSSFKLFNKPEYDGQKHNKYDFIQMKI